MDNEMIMAIGFLIWMVVFPTYLVLSFRRKRKSSIGPLAGIITIFTLGE